MYDDDSPAAEHRHRHRPNPGPRGGDRRQRRDRQGRHVLSDDREEASARAGNRASKTICRASTWSIRAARFCRCNRRFFPTASTSAASSTTWRGCRPQGIAQVAVVMGSLHRGRRVRARDVRRKYHRARSRARSSWPVRRWCAPRPARKSPPRNSAAATSIRGFGRERPSRRRRRACARRSRARSSKTSALAPPDVHRSRTRPRIRTTIRAELYGIVSQSTRASPTRCAR